MRTFSDYSMIKLQSFKWHNITSTQFHVYIIHKIINPLCIFCAAVLKVNEHEDRIWSLHLRSTEYEFIIQQSIHPIKVLPNRTYVHEKWTP